MRETREVIVAVYKDYIDKIPQLEELMFNIQKEDPAIQDRLERRYADVMLSLKSHNIEPIDYYVHYVLGVESIEDKVMFCCMMHALHPMDEMFEEVLNHNK